MKWEFQDLQRNPSCIDIVGVSPPILYIAQFLVRQGCNIRLIDKGFVSKRDIERGVLLTYKDVGDPKAVAAKKALKKINKTPIIKGFHEDLTETTAYLLSSDVVINATFDEEVAALCPENTLHIHEDLSFSRSTTTFQDKKRKDLAVKQYFESIGNIIEEVYKIV